MIRCPKCRGFDITGPRYDRTAWGSEVLRYRCVKCGYEDTTPTADAEESSHAAGETKGETK